jgi:hypothetical protein
MSDPVKQLLAAFQRDHATLGRGLHDLAVALRDRDILSAKRLAAELNQNAGPHIAFEEQYFYPKMRELIGDQEVDRLYAEHRVGQAALGRILSMPDAAWPNGNQVVVLLCDVELMERHVAECGEMFGAMGRIPAGEQRALLAQLDELRASGQYWTELAPAGQIQ